MGKSETSLKTEDVSSFVENHLYWWSPVRYQVLMFPQYWQHLQFLWLITQNNPWSELCEQTYSSQIHPWTQMTGHGRGLSNTLLSAYSSSLHPEPARAEQEAPFAHQVFLGSASASLLAEPCPVEHSAFSKQEHLELCPGQTWICRTSHVFKQGRAATRWVRWVRHFLLAVYSFSPSRGLSASQEKKKLLALRAEPQLTGLFLSMLLETGSLI